MAKANDDLKDVQGDDSPEQLIDARIAEPGDWRGETLAQIRALVKAADQGASLEDPVSLFNSRLEGNVRRAIDFQEDDEIDAKALKALLREAVDQIDS